MIFIRSEVANHYSNDLTNYRDRKRKWQRDYTAKGQTEEIDLDLIANIAEDIVTKLNADRLVPDKVVKSFLRSAEQDLVASGRGCDRLKHHLKDIADHVDMFDKDPDNYKDLPVGMKPSDYYTTISDKVSPFLRKHSDLKDDIIGTFVDNHDYPQLMKASLGKMGRLQIAEFLEFLYSNGYTIYDPTDDLKKSDYDLGHTLIVTGKQKFQ